MLSPFLLKWRIARDIPGGFVSKASLPEESGASGITMIKTFDDVKVSLTFDDSSFGFLEYSSRTREVFGNIFSIKKLDGFISFHKGLMM